MTLVCCTACCVPRGTFISLYVGVYPFHKKPGKTRLSPPRRPSPERNDRLQSTQSRSKIRQVKRKISSVFPPFLQFVSTPTERIQNFVTTVTVKQIILLSLFRFSYHFAKTKKAERPDIRENVRLCKKIRTLEH